MERVFYKFHDKLSKTTLHHTTPKQRSIIEHTFLFLAVTSFSAVILCHRTFVYRGGAIKSHQSVSIKGWNVPLMCLRSVVGNDIVRSVKNDDDDDVDVTHLVIYDTDDNSHGNLCCYNNNNKVDDDDIMIPLSMPKKEGVCSIIQENNNYCKQQKSTLNDNYRQESFVMYIEPLTGIIHSSKPISQMYNNNDNIIQSGQDQLHPHQQREQIQMQSFISQLNITYSFSQTQGLLFLPPETLPSRNISSQYIIIHPNDQTCFSDDPLLQYIGSKFTGIKDTIALNWILGFINGSNGYIHVKKNGLMIDLKDYLNEYFFKWPVITTTTTTTTTTTKVEETMSSLSSESNISKDDSNNSDDQHNNRIQPNQHHNQSIRWHHHFIIFKAGVLISSLFLFFATTTLVSFTLRETQDRMLHFTFQLQSHIHRRVPISGLIFTHVIENLVFAPIMIGIIFFLTDCCYNGDKFLAFVVLSGVWICEVFSAIR